MINQEVPKNYVIWNDFNTLENDILIEELPLVDSSEEDKEFIEVTGRHGFLTINKGSYKPIDYSFEMIVRGKEKKDIIKKAFKGSGELILSNEVSRYYKAVISGSITFERQIRDIFKVTIPFKLQPFAYERFNNMLTYTSPFIIENPTNTTAQPKLRINGSGSAVIRINDNDIMISDIGGIIILDFEMKEAYDIGYSQKNNKVSGEFYDLVEGENTITWSGGVTKVEIWTNWRWI